MTSAPVPLTSLEQLQEKISRMQSLMIADNPGFETLLREIHITLHKNEDLVHMISEEEIGKIVSGLAKKERVVIAEAMSKSKSGKTSKGDVALKNLSLDDL